MSESETSNNPIHQVIRLTLADQNFSVSKTARALGISQDTLHEFLADNHVSLAPKQISQVLGYGYARGYLQRSIPPEPTPPVMPVEPSSRHGTTSSESPDSQPRPMYLVLQLPDPRDQGAVVTFVNDLVQIGIEVERGVCPTELSLVTRVIRSDRGLVLSTLASEASQEVSGPERRVPRPLSVPLG